MTKVQAAGRKLPGASPGTLRQALRERISSGAIGLLTLAIRGYQLILSPAQTFLFGSPGGCRYTPTCSAYAVEALREHGVAAGARLAARRICRCHPWGGCGDDPVPQRNLKTEIRKPQFN